MTSTPNGHGACRVCGRTFVLTKTGLVRRHWARDGMGKGLPFSNPCDGSGETPSPRPADSDGVA